MRFFRCVSLVIGFWALPVHADGDCGWPSPCEVEGGQYLAQTPSDWDGEASLPVVVFFHGWSSSAEAMMKSQRLVDAILGGGALFVAPDGVRGGSGRKSWSHVGSPARNRDELPFIDAVIADVTKRWPTSANRMLIAGFSQGGSMVWDVACYRGARYGRYLSFSGGFWDPLPEDCPAGPVDLLHFHGTADTVVPMEGRPIGGRWHQGDILEGMKRWHAANSCPATPQDQQNLGVLACDVWDDCEAGRLKLCIHDGGHEFQARWLRREVEALAEGTG